MGRRVTIPLGIHGGNGLAMQMNADSAVVDDDQFLNEALVKEGIPKLLPGNLARVLAGHDEPVQHVRGKAGEQDGVEVDLDLAEGVLGLAVLVGLALALASTGIMSTRLLLATSFLLLEFLLESLPCHGRDIAPQFGGNGGSHGALLDLVHGVT